MRILFTGASSFTGQWFCQELAAAGHDVAATFRGDRQSYDGVRAQRVAAVSACVEPIWQCEFGSERFLEIARGGPWDLLCHHAAEMANYRSWDFDPLSAAVKTTRNCRRVLEILHAHGDVKVIVTGTVFEPYEGLGEPGQRAFSPYGLSKHISFEVFRLEAERFGMSVGKFVVANPFGPFEEFRFTGYLVREWYAGRVPTVATPSYIRDNIHVDLLARCYRRFCERTFSAGGPARCCPSGYIEAQGAFAQRFANEIGLRLGRPLEVELAHQTEFSEPLMRVNAMPAAINDPGWAEDRAWDSLALYYARLYAT